MNDFKLHRNYQMLVNKNCTKLFKLLPRQNILNFTGPIRLLKNCKKIQIAYFRFNSFFFLFFFVLFLESIQERRVTCSLNSISDFF